MNRTSWKLPPFLPLSMRNTQLVTLLSILVLGSSSSCSKQAGDAPMAGKNVDASVLPESMTAIQSRSNIDRDEEVELELEEIPENDDGKGGDSQELAALSVTGSNSVPELAATAASASTNPDVTAERRAASDLVPKPVTSPAPPPAPTPSAEKEIVMLGDPSLTSGIPGEGPLTLSQAKDWLDDPKNHRILEVQLPMGLAAASNLISGLDQNPMTRAKIELGRQLYFDQRLSKDGSVSCASCHDPREGFARHTQFGEGVNGQKGNRNSPPSYNRIISNAQFWDGRAPSLEEQAKGPIANPIEMANSHEQCVADIQSNAVYRLQFETVFPGQPVNIDTIAKAIATFERALVTAPAPYDYLERVRAIQSQYDQDELAELPNEDPELFAEYELAKKEAGKMSDAAVRGRDLFFSERSNCTACHAGANFTDEKFHNLGVGMDAAVPDLGRYEQTKVDADRGAFKTPALRNVVHTAPYMHDGSQKTLEEVVEWYAKGGHPNPYLSDKIKKLDLTEQEKKDLVAFMVEGLTSEFCPVETARLPD